MDRIEYEGALRFDLGMRAAMAQLVNSRFKRAIVYVTDGTLADSSFVEYSLTETVQYMRNNTVAFYPVYLSETTGATELEFIARETGGRDYRLFQPQGIRTISDEMLSRLTSSYTLVFEARSNPARGERYIPIEVEAFLQQRSGRGASGYFAPAQLP